MLGAHGGCLRSSRHDAGGNSTACPVKLRRRYLRKSFSFFSFFFWELLLCTRSMQKYAAVVLIVIVGRTFARPAWCVHEGYGGGGYPSHEFRMHLHAKFISSTEKKKHAQNANNNANNAVLRAGDDDTEQLLILLLLLLLLYYRYFCRALCYTNYSTTYS